MKKRILAIVMVLVVALGISSTAMADGLADDYLAINTEFGEVVEKYGPLGSGLLTVDVRNQWLNTAYKALKEAQSVGLSEADKASLLQSIKDMDALLAEKNPTTRDELIALSGDVVAKLNEAGSKLEKATITYSIVDQKGAADYGYVTVYVTPKGEAVNPEQPSATTKPMVNQTGVDMTATIVVAAALFAALAAALIVIGRKKASER